MNEKIGLKTVKTIDLTEIEEGPVEVEFYSSREETGLIPTHVRFRIDGTKNSKVAYGRKRLIFYSVCPKNSEFFVDPNKIFSLEQSIVGLEGTINGSLGDYLFGKTVQVGPGQYLEIPYETTKLRLEAWRNGKGDQSLAYFTLLNGSIPSDLEEPVLSVGGNKPKSEIMSDEDVGRLEGYFDSLRKQP